MVSKFALTLNLMYLLMNENLNVSAGIPDMGNFGIMPTRGTIHEDKHSGLSASNGKRKWWYSYYDKESEKASPGHYSVMLTDSMVQVDLLAASRFAGVHTYKWLSIDEINEDLEKSELALPGLVIDLCHAATETISNNPDNCKEAKIVFNEDSTQFNASLQFQGDLSRAPIMIHMYAHIIGNGGDIHRTSCLDPVNHGGFCFHSTDEAEISSSTGTLYTHLRMDAFPNVEKSLRIQIALSFIDIDQAVINYNDVFDLPSTPGGVEWLEKVGWTSRTDLIWCEELSRVQFESSDQDRLVQLYSANYRSLLSPTQYSEVGGNYMGFDGALHNALTERAGDLPAGDMALQFYSDLSLWDTFRTQMPWLLLSRPDLHVGILRSMVDMTSQMGTFPKWPLASVETDCMIGKHGMASFAESILSGYGEFFDIDLIEPVIEKETTTGSTRVNVDFYLEHGYVAVEDNDKAASLTLTYAFDDYSASVIENYAGNIEASEDSLKRSLNYKQIFFNESQLMCPRSSNGDFSCPETSIWRSSLGLYTEGDAEQWRYFVPHDIEGLLSLFSSPQTFEKLLLNFFSEHVVYDENFGNAAPNPYFWAGNEVDLLTPFLFNLVNCTYTQYWSRRILDMHFSSKPSGLPGNDDYGTESSFYIFTSLGLYPQAGTSRFLVGSPSVDYARIEIDDILSHTSSHDDRNVTHVLEIIAHNNDRNGDDTSKNVYVSKLLINSVEIDTPFVDRELLIPRQTGEKGGVVLTRLEFFMSSYADSNLCRNYLDSFL